MKDHLAYTYFFLRNQVKATIFMSTYCGCKLSPKAIKFCTSPSIDLNMFFIMSLDKCICHIYCKAHPSVEFLNGSIIL